MDYALAILLAIAMVVGGVIALTILWLVIAEWHFWYKKWQSRRYEGE